MNDRSRSSSPLKRKAGDLRQRSPLCQPSQPPQLPNEQYYITDLTTRELLDELRVRGIPAPNDKLGRQITLRDWCDQNNVSFMPLRDTPEEKETPSEACLRRHRENKLQEQVQEQNSQQLPENHFFPKETRSQPAPQNIFQPSSQPNMNSSRQPQQHRQRYSSSHRSPHKAPKSKESKVWEQEPDYIFSEDLNYALTDPEGAAEWEGKYGVSISKIPRLKKGENGETIPMSFSEMERSAKAILWKNTPEALLAEKARRDERKKAEEREAQESREAERKAREAKRQMEKKRQAQADLDARIEESLRRASARRAPKTWFDKWQSSWSSAEKWEIYAASWDTHIQGQRQLVINDIPWPVVTGKFEDLNVGSVKEFFMRAPREQLWGGKSASLEQLQNLVKGERIRWHPDSIQRQFGGQGVDTEVMKAVNEVSSLINEVWSGISR